MLADTGQETDATAHRSLRARLLGSLLQGPMIFAV